MKFKRKNNGIIFRDTLYISSQANLLLCTILDNEWDLREAQKINEGSTRCYLDFDFLLEFCFLVNSMYTYLFSFTCLTFPVGCVFWILLGHSRHQMVLFLVFFKLQEVWKTTFFPSVSLSISASLQIDKMRQKKAKAFTQQVMITWWVSGNVISFFRLTIWVEYLNG